MIIFRQSSSGRPALTPRTMMSTASGKVLRNCVSRRFFRNDSSQRGRPKAPAKASAAAPISPPGTIAMPTRNIATPTPAEISRNCRFDHLSPAWPIRTEIGTFLLFLWRSSNSFSVCSTTSRRDLCCPRARTTGSALATLAMRFSACRSPDRIG